MKLGAVNLESVLGASGVNNFAGEGYPYHQGLKLLFPGMFSFDGMTLVAKTTTLEPRLGNMPMREDGITPSEFKPRCIVVNPFHGVALNAVGLSGPGAVNLFERGIWQRQTKPFMLSFMSVGLTAEARIKEAIQFFDLLAKFLPYFKAPVALQINFSCPNIGLDPTELIKETLSVLEAGARLGIPLMPKFNVLIPVKAAQMIIKHPSCDGVCISNTIPWKELPESWQIKYFGSTVSPLAEFGGGGLSGAPLLPLVTRWVTQARAVGITKPINAGGGILHRRDVVTLKKAGADSVFIGSVVMLRPWRLQSIIRQAHLSFGT